MNILCEKLFTKDIYSERAFCNLCYFGVMSFKLGYRYCNGITVFEHPCDVTFKLSKVMLTLKVNYSINYVN